MAECCGTCRFWLKGWFDFKEPWGACRRSPPTVVQDVRYSLDASGLAGSFPATVGSEWCGEYRAIEQAGPP